MKDWQSFREVFIFKSFVGTILLCLQMSGSITNAADTEGEKGLPLPPTVIAFSSNLYLTLEAQLALIRLKLPSNMYRMVGGRLQAEGDFIFDVSRVPHPLQTLLVQKLRDVVSGKQTAADVYYDFSRSRVTFKQTFDPNVYLVELLNDPDMSDVMYDESGGVFSVRRIRLDRSSINADIFGEVTKIIKRHGLWASRTGRIYDFKKTRIYIEGVPTYEGEYPLLTPPAVVSPAASSSSQSPGDQVVIRAGKLNPMSDCELRMMFGPVPDGSMF